jgi:hypothetical protein
VRVPALLCVPTATHSAGPGRWASSAMCRLVQLQRHELWALHGEWVRETEPGFGPGTAERYRAASQITQEQVQRELPSDGC